MDGAYSIVQGEGWHIPFLGGIELAAARLFPGGSLPEFVFNEATPASYFEEALPSRNFWVAEHATTGKRAYPVGYALLQIIEATTPSTQAGQAGVDDIAELAAAAQNPSELALLAQLDVLPQHGCKGIGSALIKTVAEKAKFLGHPWLYLTTFRSIPWNAPFYARLGFKILPDQETPERIKAILLEEMEVGLMDRVAMRLAL